MSTRIPPTIGAVDDVGATGTAPVPVAVPVPVSATTGLTLS